MTKVRLGFGTAHMVTALALMAGAAGCGKKQDTPAAGAAPAGKDAALPVSTLTVQPTDVGLTNTWVGTLDGYTNAQIQPQVSGYLIRQDYREGAQVSKGQVLFEIDPRPFQAALAQAQGQVDQARGQLGQAQADLKLRQINVNRDTPLAEQRAIAQSQLDNDKQQQQQAEASVRSAQASIATAQAGVATAQLNLGFTRVRSLITGVAGQATTQVGNLVSQQSVLTSVSQLNPVKVYFSISDSEYLKLVHRDTANKTGDLLKRSADVPLTLTLSTGETYPQKGHLAFVDRQMNQQTGAIRIAAAFPNPGNVLRPGQFGRVSAQTEVRRGVLLVPQSAVTDLQGMKQVYLAGPDNKVKVANVTVGEQSGKNWIITGGLAAGSRVILDNVQKLAPGAAVDPHDAPADGAPVSPTTQSAGK